MAEKTKQEKIANLIPDNKNYNKGNEFGNALIEKSLRNLGAGRSILLDKNNRIIAGNKTIENAAAIGLEDIIIVETTGNQIVAVKRTDIDLDSKKGREMALADNATAKANIEWDMPVLTDDWNNDEQREWGIYALIEMPGNDELIGEEKNKPPVMKITFQTPEQLQEAESDITELLERKFKGAFYSVSAGEI